MRELMEEELAAWQSHRRGQVAGQVPWRRRYLGLPPLARNNGSAAGFVDVYPPILQLGGAEVQGRPVVVVSLEPLLDSKNFHRQLHYLSGGDVDAKWTPLFPNVIFDHYEMLQLHFWELFPQLIPGKTTTYWTNLHKLILGFVGLPHDTPFAWGNFARHVIELPLIPMHAPKHVSPDPAATGRIRALFERRLGRLAQPPAAIICLGKDAVGMFETIGAGTLVEDLQGEPGHGFGPNFDDKVKTRLHHLDVGGAVVPLFLRSAPLTSGRQPRDPGTHALGALMRQRAATIA